MVDEKRNYEYLPDNYDEEMLKRKRTKHKKGRGEEGTPELAIDSLMDILTILLVFLLKSYATDPVNITPSADLQIPNSSSTLRTEATVNISISKSGISVDNIAIPGLEVKEGKLDAAQKRGGEDSYFITQLNKVLVDAVEKKRRLASVNPNIKFDGLCTVIMDRDMPYRLLTEVMYTAAQAEFAKFKFAVISKTGEVG